MLDISGNYWFYLEPYVYCNVKKSKSLIYNTKNGAKIKVKSDLINQLIQELQKDENYGTICLDKEIINNEQCSSFIYETLAKRIGGIIPVDSNKPKPIKPLPIFRLDNDIERHMARDDKYTGKKILENLLVVDFYVNSLCDINCSGCYTYFKQATCCTVQENRFLFLSQLDVKRVISQIKHSSVGRVNIIGGDVFSYPHLDLLISEVTGVGIDASIWAHYLHVQGDLKKMEGVNYNILIPSFISELDIEKVVFNTMNCEVVYHFFVENDVDVNQAESIVSKFLIKNYQFHPIFNGTNLSFFEESVFIEKEDVFCKTFSHREIFAHQKLNTNYFGVLIVLPNGDVKANVNSKVIGNVASHKIIDMIHEELLQNTAWRKIREGDPCSDCLHQFICPSPSSYELVMGKNNLCHAFD